MDDVVQKHLSIGNEPWTLEQRPSGKRQLPVLGPCGIRHLRQRLADLRGAVIEDANELRGGFERERLVLAVTEIHTWSGQHAHPETSELGDVRSQPAEWH